MPAPKYTSLLEIVNQVARSVGHPTVTDVVSSQDEAIQRLAYYANLSGSELIYMHPWADLSKTATISIVADTPGQEQKGFDLPTDYKCMMDSTQWDKGNQMPAIGPINEQDWQWLTVRSTTISTRFLWRIRQSQLWVKSPPTTPASFTFEYRSKYWAISVGSSGEVPSELMEQSADYHVYPWQLMTLFTRWKWFENEGYDSAGPRDAFLRALEFEKANDLAAAPLSLVPGRGYPYITMDRNIPDTGYGS